MMDIEADTQEDIDEYNANVREFNFKDRFELICIGIYFLIFTSFVPYIVRTVKIITPTPIILIEFRIYMSLVIIGFLIPQLISIWYFIFNKKNANLHFIPSWAYIHFIHSKKTINHIIYLRKLNQDKLLYEFIKKLASSLGKNDFKEYKDYPYIRWYKRSIVLNMLDNFIFRVYLMGFLLIFMIQPPSFTGFYIANMIHEIGFSSNNNRESIYLFFHYSVLYSIISITLFTPYYFLPLFNDRNFFELSIKSILYDQKARNEILYRRWLFFIIAAFIFPSIALINPFASYDEMMNVLNISLPDKYLMTKLGSPSVIFSLFLIIAGLLTTFTLKIFIDVGCIILYKF